MRVQSRCIKFVSLLVLLGVAACSSDSAMPTAPSSTPANPPSTPPRVTAEPSCYSSLYQGYSQSDFGCGGVLNSFGDTSFDTAFAEEIRLQDRFYGFTVAVAPYNDCSFAEANALSDPRGFILFGAILAQKVVMTTGSDAGIAGTLAHEYAHQVQFRNGWQRPSDSTHRTTELEADAFSGVYMGLVKGFDTATVSGYFHHLANIGDYAFNNRDHHGTPNERVNAGLMGLLIADDMIENGARPTWAQLHGLFISRIGPSSLNGRLDVGISDHAKRRIEALLAGEPPVVAARGASVASLNIRPKE